MRIVKKWTDETQNQVDSEEDHDGDVFTALTYVVAFWVFVGICAFGTWATVKILEAIQ